MNALEILRDRQWMFQDFPNDIVVIDGTEIKCLMISGLAERKPLEIGGFQEEPEVTIVISLKDSDGNDAFVTIPKENDLATLNGKSYRIARTEKDPFGYTMQMDLRTPHK